jgi:hypothetical protein
MWHVKWHATSYVFNLQTQSEHQNTRLQQRACTWLSFCSAGAKAAANVMRASGPDPIRLPVSAGIAPLARSSLIPQLHVFVHYACACWLWPRCAVRRKRAQSHLPVATPAHMPACSPRRIMRMKHQHLDADHGFLACRAAPGSNPQAARGGPNLSHRRCATCLRTPLAR